MIVTIACPKKLTHPEIDKETAPIWVNKKGDEYFVASGIIEAGDILDTSILVAYGKEGLTALSEFGLTLKEN